MEEVSNQDYFLITFPPLELGREESWKIDHWLRGSSSPLPLWQRRANTENTISEVLLDTCVAPRKTIFSPNSKKVSFQTFLKVRYIF